MIRDGVDPTYVQTEFQRWIAEQMRQVVHAIQQFDLVSAGIAQLRADLGDLIDRFCHLEQRLLDSGIDGVGDDPMNEAGRLIDIVKRLNMVLIRQWLWEDPEWEQTWQQLNDLLGQIEEQIAPVEEEEEEAAGEE
jgi:hypothetical protein